MRVTVSQTIKQGFVTATQEGNSITLQPTLLITNPDSLTNHSQLNLDDGTNPHGTAASDVGLGNVDNTSDLDKPISTATQTALDGKVDDAQVLTNVPIGALFTDTVYDDTAIQAEVDLNTAKRSYPLADETRLADTSGINTGNQKEEDIISTVLEPTIVAGAYTFETDLSRSFHIVMTQNTTFTMPTLANSTSIVFTVVLSGTFVATFTGGIILPTSDTYNGTVKNDATIKCQRLASGVQENVISIINRA